MFWDGGKYKIQTSLGKQDNAATFSMASGFNNFQAFCCVAKLDEITRDAIAMPSGFVSDDKELEACDEDQRTG